MNFKHHRGVTTGLATIFAVLLLAVTPALAGVGGAVVPIYPPTVTTGNTNVAVNIVIVNNSTSSNDTEHVSVQSIVHTPSCGSSALPVCLSGSADPGVFDVISPGTGRAGTACAGITFTVGVSDATTGQVEFTPSAAVSLGPSSVGGAAATCIIDFVVDVLKVPAIDGSASIGIQTYELAAAIFKGETSFLVGGASGASLVTVDQGSPTPTTIASIASPTSGTVDVTVLNDQAVLSGGFHPTGTITFELFSPSDPTCAAAPAFTEAVTVNGNGTYSTTLGVIANQAGMWQWTAQYSGDANNNPVSTACGAEPVLISSPTVEAQITDLIALIDSFNLQPALESGLIKKLEAVLAASDQASACRHLNVFIRQVQDQPVKKLTVAQASQLIAAANQIKATLKCP